MPIDAGSCHVPDPADLGDAIGARPWSAKACGSSSRPLVGERASIAFQQRDLLREQFRLEQHLTQPYFEVLTLALLAVNRLAGKVRPAAVEKGVTSIAQYGRRHAKLTRHHIQILTAQKVQYLIALAFYHDAGRPRPGGRCANSRGHSVINHPSANTVRLRDVSINYRVEDRA